MYFKKAGDADFVYWQHALKFLSSVELVGVMTFFLLAYLEQPGLVLQWPDAVRCAVTGLAAMTGVFGIYKVGFRSANEPYYRALVAVQTALFVLIVVFGQSSIPAAWELFRDACTGEDPGNPCAIGFFVFFVVAVGYVLGPLIFIALYLFALQQLCNAPKGAPATV